MQAPLLPVLGKGPGGIPEQMLLAGLISRCTSFAAGGLRLASAAFRILLGPGTFAAGAEGRSGSILRRHQVNPC